MEDQETIEVVTPEQLVRDRWVVAIEGMGGYDERDPEGVAARVAANLRDRGVPPGPGSPALIVTQGDPATPRGIAAITERVARKLELERAVVVFDVSMDPDHARDADVRGVRALCYYSQLAAMATKIPATPETDLLATIETRVKAGIDRRNRQRAALGKAPLADYFERFACLQELTKSVLRRFADRLLVAHTASEISPFSVTSFCDVGLDSGLVAHSDMVPFDMRPGAD